ncbi:GumC family protein [Acidiphilium sp.]|uniref:GumC family protein n=1 Tax=Acidiphilium sp. TaxID=527 RepID=UPI003CFD87BB
MSGFTHRYTAADHFMELLETGFMKRRMILAGCGLILVAAFAIALLVKPTYIATSQLLVLPSDAYAIRTTAGSHSLANQAMSREAMVGSEIAILKSPALAHEVIAGIGLQTLYPALARKPGLLARVYAAIHDLMAPPPPGAAHHDPINRAIPLFESHLNAIAGPHDDVITLSFGHRNPVLAQRVVSVLEQDYLRRRERIFSDDQSAAVARRVRAEREALDQAESRLTAFEIAHNVTQFEAREAILLGQQGRMEQDLMTATSSVAQLTTSLAALRHERHAAPPTIALQQSVDTDERTASLRTSLDDLRSRLAALLSNYRSDSPEAENLRRQIATQTALLAHATANGAPSSRQSGPNPVYATINLDLLQDTAALAAGRIRATQDRRDLTIIEGQLTRLETLKAQWVNLQRQQTVAAADYADAARTLSDRRMIEQVDAETSANVRVLSPPLRPMAPFPLRKLIMLAGVILAIVGAALTVLLANFFRRGALLGRVLEADSGIPLLAIIPELDHSRLALLPRWR